VGNDGGFIPLGGLVYFKNVGACLADGGRCVNYKSTLPATTY